MVSSAPESRSGSHEPPVPNGEFPFTWSDFRKIAALVHSESGIVITESKVNLVYSRLAKRLRAIGLKTFRQYCELIQCEDGVDERQAMIAAMTTNVTRFFREPHHFDHLREELLPHLIEKARSGGRVRIWSAGCSSGEEPYSIAMTVLGKMPEAAETNFLILASDLDHNMVARGRAALYDAKLVESIPFEMRRSFLAPVEESGKLAFRITDSARTIVRFKELNLLEPWPIKGRFDAIFCRNVMIYFDEQTQNRIWKRFSEVMVPEATLFIGHSERIATERQPFDLVAQTTYRLRTKGSR